MPDVLFFIGNGYSFTDFHEFIILDLKGKCNVFLIIEENAYLSKKLMEKVKRLHRECYVKKYYLADLHASRSILINFRNCTELLKQVSKEKIDLFFCGEEGSMIICFMMEYFKLKGTKVVSCEIIIRSILHIDYKKKTEGVFPGTTENESLGLKLWRKIKNKEFDEIYKYVVNFFLRTARIPRIKLQNVLGLHLIPLLLIRRSIKPTNKYMIGTKSDYLIVIDPLEFEGVKLLIPTAKKLYLAKHPVYEFCKNNHQKKTKLLLIIGNSNDDYKEKNIDRLIIVIEEIRRLKNPTQIHLRMHPREYLESKRKYLEQIFESKNIKYVVIDPVANAITDDLCKYMGAVCTFSSAIRILRNGSPDMFIIGLADMTKGLFSHPWAMGSTEGVHWLRERDSFKKEMLNAPRLVKNENPSISEIINDILNENKAA